MIKNNIINSFDQWISGKETKIKLHKLIDNNKHLIKLFNTKYQLNYIANADVNTEFNIKTYSNIINPIINSEEDLAVLIRQFLYTVGIRNHNLLKDYHIYKDETNKNILYDNIKDKDKSFKFINEMIVIIGWYEYNFEFFHVNKIKNYKKNIKENNDDNINKLNSIIRYDIRLDNIDDYKNEIFSINKDNNNNINIINKYTDECIKHITKQLIIDTDNKIIQIHRNIKLNKKK